MNSIGETNFRNSNLNLVQALCRTPCRHELSSSQMHPKPRSIRANSRIIPILRPPLIFPCSTSPLCTRNSKGGGRSGGGVPKDRHGRAHIATVGTVPWRGNAVPARAVPPSLPLTPLLPRQYRRSSQDTEAAARATCPCTPRAARARTKPARPSAPPELTPRHHTTPTVSLCAPTP